MRPPTAWRRRPGTSSRRWAAQAACHRPGGGAGRPCAPGVVDEDEQDAGLSLVAVPPSGDRRAATFDEGDVAPDAVVAADALAGCRRRGTRRAGAGRGWRCSRGRSRTGWSRCPPPRWRRSGRRAGGGPPPAAGVGVDVDRVLDDAGVDARSDDTADAPSPATLTVASRATQRWPGSSAASNCSQLGRFGFEGGLAGGDAEPVDRPGPASACWRAHRGDADAGGAGRSAHRSGSAWYGTATAYAEAVWGVPQVTAAAGLPTCGMATKPFVSAADSPCDVGADAAGDQFVAL